MLPLVQPHWHQNADSPRKAILELAVELRYHSCTACFAGMQNSRVTNLGDLHPSSREKSLRGSRVAHGQNLCGEFPSEALKAMLSRDSTMLSTPGHETSAEEIHRHSCVLLAHCRAVGKDLPEHGVQRCHHVLPARCGTAGLNASFVWIQLCVVQSFHAISPSLPLEWVCILCAPVC